MTVRLTLIKRLIKLLEPNEEVPNQVQGFLS